MAVNPYGVVISEAPVGIEWMLDVYISPKAAEDEVIQAVSANRTWESAHRGGASPDLNGYGLGYEDYTVYRK